jgi:ABC-2 type transport system ATP-binding protein
LALVNDPELVFLDEPTTGLDPQARQGLWDLVRQLKSEGRSVLLTTHYMEEAEALCDRVGIMDRGQILQLGTPRELIAGLNQPSVAEIRKMLKAGTGKLKIARTLKVGVSVVQRIADAA